MVAIRSGLGFWARAILRPSVMAVPKPSFRPRSMMVMLPCLWLSCWMASMVPSVLPSSMMIILRS